MRVFTIEDQTNNITSHGSVRQAGALANAMRFRSEASLSRLARDWPASRLVDIWNGLPGVKPVSRFRDRATAVSRIWQAIQTLRNSVPGAATKKKLKKTPGNGGAPREGSKTSRIIAMLRRQGGTTIDEIMIATDWQRHTARAMLSAGGSLTKKHGLIITSEKVGGQRKYFAKS